MSLLSCEKTLNTESKNTNISFVDRYNNSGFALIYNKNMSKIKNLDERSLDIYHKSLKKWSVIKITNPENGKYLIANVKSNRVKFSNFYNSVLSLRIAEELDLDINEPYVEINLVSKNSTFVATKAKMFEEEREVAQKAPVDGIIINDLNLKKVKKIKVNKKKFKKGKLYWWGVINFNEQMTIPVSPKIKYDFFVH